VQPLDYLLTLQSNYVREADEVASTNLYVCALEVVHNEHDIISKESLVLEERAILV